MINLGATKSTELRGSVVPMSSGEATDNQRKRPRLSLSAASTTPTLGVSSRTELSSGGTRPNRDNVCDFLVYMNFTVNDCSASGEMNTLL